MAAENNALALDDGRKQTQERFLSSLRYLQAEALRLGYAVLADRLDAALDAVVAPDAPRRPSRYLMERSDSPSMAGTVTEFREPGAPTRAELAACIEFLADDLAGWGFPLSAHIVSSAALAVGDETKRKPTQD